MPHLDNSGPEGKGPRTGRKLGKCRKKDDEAWPMGRGMGKRRRQKDKDGKGEGKGKRLQSGREFEDER
jgi:hypothetical protein